MGILVFSIGRYPGIQFLGAVPIEPKIVLSGDSGMPIVIDDPDSVSAKVFKEITEKIIKTVE